MSNISKDDIIVRFNVGVGVGPNDRTDMVFFRKTATGYIGFNGIFKITNTRLLKPGIKYFFIDENRKWIQRIQVKNPEIRKKYMIIKSGGTRRQYGWNPSSGFVAINYFMKKYPGYGIKLFNFSWQGWSGHNFSKEKRLCYDWIKSGKISVLGDRISQHTQIKKEQKKEPEKTQSRSPGGHIKPREPSIMEILGQYGEIYPKPRKTYSYPNFLQPIISIPGTSERKPVVDSRDKNRKNKKGKKNKKK